jgi:hypothetical protein
MIRSKKNQSADENDIICWHWDHSKSRNVKGINFVSCLYQNRGVSLPVNFRLVKKTEKYIDPLQSASKTLRELDPIKFSA